MAFPWFSLGAMCHLHSGLWLSRLLQMFIGVAGQHKVDTRTRAKKGRGRWQANCTTASHMCAHTRSRNTTTQEGTGTDGSRSPKGFSDVFISCYKLFTSCYCRVGFLGVDNLVFCFLDQFYSLYTWNKYYQTVMLRYPHISCSKNKLPRLLTFQWRFKI